MTGKAGRLAGLNAAPNNGFKKRVFKACERCKLKKVKCEGVSPCQRCKADDVICLFKKTNSRKSRDVPAGYVEFLETRYQLLAQGLRESHARLVAASLLPAPVNSAASSPSSIPDLVPQSETSIQTILSQLGIQPPDQTCCDQEHQPDEPSCCSSDFTASATELEGLSVPTVVNTDTSSESTGTPISSPLDDVFPTFDTSELRFSSPPSKNPFAFVMPEPEFMDSPEFWGLNTGMMNQSASFGSFDELEAMDVMAAPPAENVMRDPLGWNVMLSS